MFKQGMQVVGLAALMMFGNAEARSGGAEACSSSSQEESRVDLLTGIMSQVGPWLDYARTERTSCETAATSDASSSMSKVQYPGSWELPQDTRGDGCLSHKLSECYPGRYR